MRQFVESCFTISETSEVPGRPSSFGSRWPSTVRSASRYHLSVPRSAEHVRASGLIGRRSNFVELFAGSSSWSNTEFWQFQETT